MTSFVDFQSTAIIFVFGCACAFIIVWIALKIVLSIKAKEEDREMAVSVLPHSPSLISRLVRFIYASEKAKVAFWVLLTMILIHVSTLLFFADMWGQWKNNTTFFLGTNFSIAIIAFLVFSGFRYGKRIAFILSIIFTIGLFQHVRQTETWKEVWEDVRWSNPASATGAVTVAKKPERWLLKYLYQDVPKLVEETGWPPVYEIEVRNLDIRDYRFNFDVWEASVGIRGEYRWDKRDSPARGTYSHRYPTGWGAWFLEFDSKTERYVGWCWWKRDDGRELKVPIRLYLDE